MSNPADEALCREAADPATSPARLSRLLDVCDAQRMEFAGQLGPQGESAGIDPKSLESVAQTKSLGRLVRLDLPP